MTDLAFRFVIRHSDARSPATPLVEFEAGINTSAQAMKLARILGAVAVLLDEVAAPEVEPEDPPEESRDPPTATHFLGVRCGECSALCLTPPGDGPIGPCGRMLAPGSSCEGFGNAR